MALQNRTAMWGRSVISNCYCDGGNITSNVSAGERAKAEAEGENGRAVAYEGVCSDPRDETWASWLREHGVRRVIVGHKPSGDSPAVLSSRYTGVEVLSADTSYSDPQTGDGRGGAVAGILLRGESLDAMHSVVFGVLRDGSVHEATLPTLSGGQDGRGGDPFVGVELADGWWVKARLKKAEPEASYLLCRGEFRTVNYRVVSATEVSALLANAPKIKGQPDEAGYCCTIL